MTGYVVPAPQQTDALVATLRAAYVGYQDDDLFEDLLRRLDTIDYRRS